MEATSAGDLDAMMEATSVGIWAAHLVARAARRVAVAKRGVDLLAIPAGGPAD